ncbi:MAG: trypsin-like peptidase domain-containing protein [Fibrobacteres bacterium]|nr:trypsin-like peptidase domain-containing protein [Fibrobacterota bacterium]
MTPNDIAKRIIFFLLLLIAFNITWNRLAPHYVLPNNSYSRIPKDSIMKAEESGRLLSYIAGKVSASVVSITAKGSGEMGTFFGETVEVMKESKGTGIIIDDEGLIATNAHIIAGCVEIRIKTADGREFDAVSSVIDTIYDVAIIKIQGESLTVCSIGKSDKLQQGEWILAIGNPMGLDHSVTFGIVSGIGRTDTLANGKTIDYIQTDAAINQGNSGGPLVNLDGEVVGMTTFIMSPTGGNSGVGFAIPIKRVMERIAKLSAALKDLPEDQLQ